MKKFNVTVAAMLIGLCGCSATVKPMQTSATVKQMQTPDGKDGALVTCDGSADDWASCYAAATMACSSGKYRVIDKNESTTPTAYGPLIRRNLIAECK